MNSYKPSFMFAVVLLTGVVSAWVGVTQADFGDGRVLSYERRAYFRQGGYLRITTFFFDQLHSAMRQVSKAVIISRLQTSQHYLVGPVNP